MTELTPEILRILLDYDPETGHLTWKKRDISFFKREKDWKIWNTKYSGKRAGGVGQNGYIRVCVLGSRPLLGHRLAWMHYYGDMPGDQVDHINGLTGDNRICNLRSASHSENNRNRHMSKGKIPLKGVCENLNKYVSYIDVDSKRIHLGRFDTPEEAHAAYCEAAQKYHGEFWNPGNHHVP